MPPKTKQAVKVTPAPPGKKAATLQGEKPAAHAGGNTADAPSSHKRTQVEQDYDRLRMNDKLDDGVDAIGPKGLTVLASELGVQYNDADFFLCMWKLGATQSYCITRSEWLHSMYLHKVEHMGHLKALITNWKAAIKEDDSAFAEMYNHTYDFIRGEDEKLLPLDKAIRAWQTLLPEERFHFLPLWAQWCTVDYKRPVSRDVWRQLWEFSSQIKDLEKYDPNDKWPTALDDFVEWAKEKMTPKQVAPAPSPAGAK
jgi:DCN1-like protein 1/2